MEMTENPSKSINSTYKPAPETPVAEVDPDWPMGQHRKVIFVTIPQFMGYAALFALQRKIKQYMGIPDDDSSRSHYFQVGCTMLYIGNLCFRLLHNIFFFFLIPRHRVYLSLSCMCSSMLVIVIFIFMSGSQSLGWVFLAYGLGGVGIGSFEANLVSTITPLGHKTKMWAILGFPVGVLSITTGSYIMMAIAPESTAMIVAQYIMAASMIVVAILVMFFFVPVVQVRKDNERSIGVFWADLKAFKEWGKSIVFHSFALMLDMFGVALLSAGTQYIYDLEEVPMFGHESIAAIPFNIFYVINNIYGFVGDSLSRQLFYKGYTSKWQFNPLWYIPLNVLGIVLALSKVGFLAPIGQFCVMYANGAIYAMTCKHIDDVIPREFNLISLSFWLFIGDLGSIVGSLLVSHVKVWVGPL